MLGCIDFAPSQITDQQLVATEYIQRKEAVMIIVAMKEPALLATMDRIVGGIKIKNQLFGRRGKRSNKPIKEYLMDGSCFLSAHTILKSA